MVEEILWGLFSTTPLVFIVNKMGLNKKNLNCHTILHNIAFNKFSQSNLSTAKTKSYMLNALILHKVNLHFLL